MRKHWYVQKVKALNKRAEEKFPLLKDLCGKDGTAVVKKKIMMLFVNASKSEPLLISITRLLLSSGEVFGGQIVAK